MQQGNQKAVPLFPVADGDAATKNNNNNNINYAQYMALFPTGFRFNPKDEELIFYLNNKVTGHGFLPPLALVREVDIYKHSPQQLRAIYNPKGENNSMFFFSPRNWKHARSNRVDRRVADFGYWKASRKASDPIKCGPNAVGSKNTLVFHIGKPKEKNKTNWLMHEFILDNQLDDWVLCQIYGRQTKDDKPKCKDIEEVEIPKQVLQNATLESESQQNEPSMVMAIDAFISTTPANSTHCLGYCEPITHFFDNGNDSVALLPEPSMGDLTYSMPSMPGDNSGFMLLQWPPVDDQVLQNSALESQSQSQSQQNQPSMVMPIDTFIPTNAIATPAHSTHYSGNCEPITPFFDNGDYSATLLPKPSMGDWTYSMPSVPGDDNCFDNGDYSTTLLPKPSMGDWTYSMPSMPDDDNCFDNGDYSTTLLPKPSMGDWTYPMPSMPDDDNCFDNGDYSVTLLPKPSMGDWTYSMPSMPDDDNCFMLPQWPLVDDQSMTGDFDAFNQDYYVNIWEWNL